MKEAETERESDERRRERNDNRRRQQPKRASGDSDSTRDYQWWCPRERRLRQFMGLGGPCD